MRPTAALELLSKKINSSVIPTGKLTLKVFSYRAISSGGIRETACMLKNPKKLKFTIK
jgi:hypothetical protein